MYNFSRKHLRAGLTSESNGRMQANATERTNLNGQMHSVASGSVYSVDSLIKAFDLLSNSSGNIHLNSFVFGL